MILGLLLKDGARHSRRFLGEHLAFLLSQLVLLEKPLAFRRVEAAADEPLALGRAELRLELAKKSPHQPDNCGHS